MTEELKFLLIRDVKSPSRAFPTDAGIDFFVPEFNEEFIDSLLGAKPNGKAFRIPVTKYEDIVEKKYPDNSSTSFVNGFTLTNGAAPENLNTQDFFGFDIEEGKPYFILETQQRVMIPSGVKSRMAKPGRALIAANKSGVAVKHGLVFGAEIIDYSYRGEIHLSVINTSNEAVRIYAGMKLIQFVETPILSSKVVSEKSKGDESEANFFEGLENDRKDGGFGSTDKK